MGMRVEESQKKRKLFCNGADTGSRFAGHENVQTSDMVFNHVKRLERNNHTGVDDSNSNVTDGRMGLKSTPYTTAYREGSF